MSIYLLNVLGFFVVSFIVVSATVGVMFRDDLRLAWREYKEEREIKKQKKKLI